MHLNYKLSQSEVVKAMQLNSQFSKKSLALFAAIAFALLLLGSMSNLASLFYSGVVGGVIGACVVFYLLVPWAAKRQYKTDPYYAHEISLSVSEHGLEFKSHDWESELKWSDIQRWKHSKGMYLLYVARNRFYMVPERSLPDPSQLSTQLTTHLGQKLA